MAVQESPVTRASLLLRLRDRSDDAAWREFVELYSPLIYRFARKRGLQDADAADLMQDVLRSLAGAIGRLEYDQRRGSFRGWLFTITRNRLYDQLSARRNPIRGAGDSPTAPALDSLAAGDPGLEQAWNREYERQLAARAMERIRGDFQSNTWEAFWKTAVDGDSAADVANLLGMSPGAVYVAKSRVLARLKSEVQRAQDEEL